MLASINNDIIFRLSKKILEDCKNKSIDIRFFGSIALLYLDRSKIDWLSKHRRPIGDIDIVVKKDHISALEKYFMDLGFEDNRNIKMLHGNQRRSFYSPENISIDVFIGNIYLCQNIELLNRFYLDYPTITISDLFLSKMQKHDFTNTDIFDIDFILDYNIDKEYVLELCLKDWRWWKTLQTNVQKLLENEMSEKNKKILDELLLIIHKQKKSFKWEIRNIIGSSIQWYNNVEE